MEGEVFYLGALVSEYLERRGQGLVAGPEQAELVVELSARTREGARLQGICFSLLDLELVVRDKRAGEEIFTTSIKGIKGAGPDYEQAGIKAYEKAGQQLKEQVLPDLLDHLNR